MQVIFVSADRNKEAYEEYLREQPWLSIPYEEDKIRTKLQKHFDVEG